MTLAERMGIKAPASELLKKAAQLRLRNATDFEWLAVARGCWHYRQPQMPEPPKVDKSFEHNTRLMFSELKRIQFQSLRPSRPRPTDNGTNAGIQPPTVSAVIRPDQDGPAEILLESSTDMEKTWQPAALGVYGATDRKRFFRLRAEKEVPVNFDTASTHPTALPSVWARLKIADLLTNTILQPNQFATPSD